MRRPGRQLMMSLAVVLAQFASAMAVTFIAALAVRAESFQHTRPVLFAFVLGLAFVTGICLAGWIALKVHLLDGPPRSLPRLGGAAVGTYVPLIAALLLYDVLEPGNPFFFVSLLVGSIGFQAPGWFGATDSLK